MAFLCSVDRRPLYCYIEAVKGGGRDKAMRLWPGGFWYRPGEGRRSSIRKDQMPSFHFFFL